MGMGVRKPPIPITTLPCRLFFLWKKGRTYLSAVTKKESRSHCTSSVGGRWAVKFPDNTVPIISKMEDFTMLGYTAYQFSIVGPFALVCFFGAAVMWFSGIR